MKRLVCLSCLIVLLVSGVESRAQESALEFTPLFDLRVRQEVLDGVLYFAPDPDRQWVRFRTRAGVKAESGSHTLTVRLANEHRRFMVPEPDEFDWDELIVDQFAWTWRISDKTRLTLGRQNIIWDEGFLVLEGHPLDGSRSIYMDGVRLRSEVADLFLVRNSKRDPFVLAGDEDRALSDADEIGFGSKFSFGQHTLTAIWKQENDPDNVLPLLNTYTVDGRFFWGSKKATNATFEMALQYLDGLPEAAADGPVTETFAVALQGKVKGHLFGPVDADLGLFFYEQNFRTPWGRWPKWSELYIYTLLGEGGDGRVHVAAWENIAAPRMNLHYRISESFRARWGLAYLLAPEPDWQARGLLMQTELKFDLVKGFDGHLLWEMFDPGSFHYHLGGMDNPVHFLRWQLAYAFK